MSDQQWISLKDNLPTERVRVLLCAEGMLSHRPLYYVGYREGNTYFSHDGREGYITPLCWIDIKQLSGEEYIEMREEYQP